jgi:hypothetical protein
LRKFQARTVDDGGLVAKVAGNLYPRLFERLPVCLQRFRRNEASSMRLRALMVPSLLSLAVGYKPLGHQAHAVAPMKGHEQDGAN